MKQQRSGVVTVLALLAAATAAATLARLALAFDRWRWSALCERICGPYLPIELSPAALVQWRQALDWMSPLAQAGALCALLLALLFWLHAAQPAPGNG